MSGLAQQIRDRLDGFEDAHCFGSEDVRCDVYGFDEMREALLALLDLHAYPEGSGIPGEVHCGELIDWVQGGCPTLRTIAEKLRIEASDG